jgi:hypothetical protein
VNALAPDPAVCQVSTADGAVLLDAEHGRLYGLNPTGSAVWQGLAAGRSVEQIIGDLAARFAAQPERIRADVEVLITQLRDRGLLGTLGPRR